MINTYSRIACIYRWRRYHISLDQPQSHQDTPEHGCGRNEKSSALIPFCTESKTKNRLE